MRFFTCLLQGELWNSFCCCRLGTQNSGGRTFYQLPSEPNLPVSTRIFQATGSSRFFSLWLALIFQHLQPLLNSPSDGLPSEAFSSLPICAPSPLAQGFLCSQQVGPSQHETLPSAKFWVWGNILKLDKLLFHFWPQCDLGEFIQRLSSSSVKWG